MQSNLLAEELVSFRDLSKRLQEQGVKRGAGLATVHRWRARNQLAAVRIGGVWHTSMQEFARFVARRSQGTSHGVKSSQSPKVENLSTNGEW